jgi:uncharacterized low-complexity protein
LENFNQIERKKLRIVFMDSTTVKVHRHGSGAPKKKRPAKCGQKCGRKRNENSHHHGEGRCGVDITGTRMIPNMLRR